MGKWANEGPRNRSDVLRVFTRYFMLVITVVIQ